MMPDSVDDNLACRICMDLKDSYVSLFTHELSKKVMEVADVQVEEDDGLPSTICVECNVDLEKCYEFRLKVQHADKKFRDHIAFSQVEIEECKIKEEREPYTNDGHSDNMDDRDSSSSTDDENFNNEPDESPKKDKENEEIEPDPMNHVVVIEEKDQLTKIEMPEVALCHDEPMTEDEIKKVEEVVVDPLGCKTEVMDVDNINHPETFTPSSSVQSSSVSATEYSQNYSILQPRTSSAEGSPGQVQGQSYLLLRQILSDNSLAVSSGFKLVPFVPIVPGGVVPSVNNSRQTMLQPNSSTHVYGNTSFLSLNPGGNGKAASGSKQYKKDSNLIKNPASRSLKNNSVSIKNSQLYNSRTNQKKEISNISLFGTEYNTAMKKSGIRKLENINVQSKQTSDSNSETSSSAKAHILNPNTYTTHGSNLKNDSFCSVCYVDCGSLELLQEHKNRKGFVCRTCTFTFDDHTDLESHFMSHKAFTCKTCAISFYYKKDLFRHRESGQCVRPRKYCCKFCNRQFFKITQLKYHLRTHEKVDQVNGEMCVVCKKFFRNAQFLISHGKTSHLVYEYMECNTCHKLFLGPAKLKHHIQTIHIEPTTDDSQFPCPTCKKIFTHKSTLKVHVDKHDNTQYVCEVCGESVTGKLALKFHKYNHVQRIFSCTSCSEQFDSKAKLNRHRKNHISSKKIPETVFCEICGKKYKSLSILKLHLAIHSDEKPFKCEICGAAFKQKTILKTHSRVHNSVKKFCCNECGLSFNWKQTFIKHVANCEGNKDHSDDGNSA